MNILGSVRKYFGKTEPSAPPPSAEAQVVTVDADILIRQAAAELGQERYAEAIALYEKAIAARPEAAGGYIGLGFTHLRLGQVAPAITALQNAVARNPQSVDGLYMLGKACLAAGQGDSAEQAWQKLHLLDPAFEHVYVDHCFLLFSRGKADQATVLIKKGIDHHPQNADFHFCLGNLLSEAGDHSGALNAYAAAREIVPPWPELLSNIATALRQTGQLDASIEALKAATDLAPDNASILSNYLMGVQYSDKFSKQEKFDALQVFAKRFESPLLDQWGHYRNDPNPDRKLKIGYVSGDFRNHSLAFFIEPVLRNHDRSAFEIHCYYSHPSFDNVSANIKALADQWHGIFQMPDEALAQKIRADGIDILIDLSGHTGHNRLLAFARKPAPIQMTWLGYQASTGLRAIDFRVTDEAMDPTGTSEAYHSEKLLRLPVSGAFTPSPVSPPVNLLPALDGRPFMFGCLNNPSKITDEAIRLWARILAVVPNSQLMIGNATSDVIARISSQFALHHVGVDRLSFQPRVSLAGYLALHNQIDLALDTFPYNGGTTTFHSLWMGVPLIALAGDTSLSRVGISMMNGLGLPEFCASTADEYVERAVWHATHLPELDTVRQSMRAKMETLNHHMALGVTSSLESAFREQWHTYCAQSSRS
ncbi:MAG: tetratricopeptide repeat protein [Variovorax sp.]|nr:tetratricopeptide repeat protein [Variovorax sp.]